MDFKYFFINTLKIEEQGLDIGFDLYCTGHLIWLAAIVAAAIFMARYYRRQKVFRRCHSLFRDFKGQHSHNNRGTYERISAAASLRTGYLCYALGRFWKEQKNFRTDACLCFYAGGHIGIALLQLDRVPFL